MAKLRVDIDIPAERYVALYAGQAKTIYAVSMDGVKVRFPGSALRKFVTHEGVSGSFVLQFDRNYKLTGIERGTARYC